MPLCWISSRKNWRLLNAHIVDGYCMVTPCQESKQSSFLGLGWCPTGPYSCLFIPDFDNCTPSAHLWLSIVLFFALCRVFFLEIPNDSVMERLSLRATDPITGERYHMLYNPPRTQEVSWSWWALMTLCPEGKFRYWFIYFLSSWNSASAVQHQHHLHDFLQIFHAYIQFINIKCLFTPFVYITGILTYSVWMSPDSFRH